MAVLAFAAWGNVMACHACGGRGGMSVL